MRIKCKKKYSEYGSTDYIAVPFSIASQDMVKILQAQNFVSLDMESDSTIDTLLKNWKLKTTTKTFTVTQNDILIFNMDWKIVDCLENEKNQLYRDVLESNGYIVKWDLDLITKIVDEVNKWK